MNRKNWYLTGLAGAAISAAACSCLDHVRNFELYDKLFTPFAVALFLACAWMLVAGVIWSRSGIRSHVVGLAVFNAFVPIIVGLLVSAFGVDPNVHGSAALLLLFGLVSIFTMVAMLIGTFLPKRKKQDA